MVPILSLVFKNWKALELVLNCTQMHLNSHQIKLLYPRLAPGKCWKTFSPIHALGGREGVNGKTINQRSELLRFTHLAIVR